MKKKVVLITLHTGFNYGTLLQAFSMNKIIEECGFAPVMLWHKDGIVKGRDITLSKLVANFVRSIIHPIISKRIIGGYTDNFSYKMTKESKEMFLQYAHDTFNVKKMSYNGMKRLCCSEEVKAVCCGSDQIWKSNLLYVSPYYFLRFAPPEKRIAYAPSFGCYEVPKYNKRIFSKYLNDFSKISVREDSGQKIVKDLTGKDCFVALDPTLAVNKNIWKNLVKKQPEQKYILCYFLDEPTELMLQNIRNFQELYHLSIKIIPFLYKCFSSFSNCYFENAGPIEFLNLVFNADFIFTDSFHCSVFSVIFQRNFYIVERNHKNSSSGNTRILSFLKLTKLYDRYVEKEKKMDFSNAFSCDFSSANQIIEIERAKSISFLKNAINSCL